ncbi:MAG: ABC transporter permease [Acidobacteria bacterium]|nr:ABC transporter permease [Acidobacteriota bacterium]
MAFARGDVLAVTLRRLLRRATLALVTFLIATATLYVAMRALPGGPWGDDPLIPGPVLQEWRARHHLDDGVVAGYAAWLLDVAAFRLGTSYTVAPGEDVARIIGRAAPTSLALGLLGLGLGLVIAVAAAMAAAAHPGGPWDRGWSGLVYLLYAVPGFWLAILLQNLFAQRLHWVPLFGSGSDLRPTGVAAADLLARARHWLLPPLCLALGSLALLFRSTRAGLLDASRSLFVRAGRARGIPRRSLIARHAFAGVRIQLATWAALAAPSLVGGSVVVEKIFGFPGVGRLFLAAIEKRDYPLVMGIGVCLIGVSVLASAAADAAYEVLDPRLSRARGRA